MSATGGEQSARGVTRRIAVRLLPYLFLLYIIAFLDRVNISYAGLEMVRDLGSSDRVFGLGRGNLSVGYVVFEIPGALLIERWSARRVMARILIAWVLQPYAFLLSARPASSMERDSSSVPLKPDLFQEFLSTRPIGFVMRIELKLRPYSWPRFQAGPEFVLDFR